MCKQHKKASYLPGTGKQTDVTFSSAETYVVILRLKQMKNNPTPAFMTEAHDQLLGYADTRRAMEDFAKRRPVVGFVVILFVCLVSC